MYKVTTSKAKAKNFYNQNQSETTINKTAAKSENN